MLLAKAVRLGISIRPRDGVLLPALVLLLALPALLAWSPAADAQEAAVAEPDTFGWKNSLVAGVTFSQSAFSNWTAGGTNSLAWTGSLRGAFLQREPRFDWRHTGNFEYGAVRLEGEGYRKSVDLIELETLYTRKIKAFVEPYASAWLKTQFVTGRNFDAVPDTASDGDLIFPATSDFADPLFLAQSVGVSKTIIAPDELRTRGGFTIHETITDVHRGYAIQDDGMELTFDECKRNPACDKTKIEPGLESITEYAKKLAETTALTSRLSLFYAFNQADELDVNWRSDLTIKALEFLSVNFGIELLFDEDVIDRLQTKQVLGIGVSYALLEVAP
jgi:hypothetical protein